MSTTWTFAQLVDALKLQVEALPVILAMNPKPVVRVSMPHAAEDVSDVIVFGVDAEGTKEQIALGSHTHDEEVTVGCAAGAIRYGSGDVEAKAARDRVLAFVSIIDEEIRTNTPTVGTQTLWARVTDYVFESWPAEVGENNPVRVARVSFNILYKARTNPTP